MEIRLDHVSASGSCDGYQVLFEAEEDGLGAYVLLQRHFEEPDPVGPSFGRQLIGLTVRPR